MTGLFSFLGQIFKPASDIIDELHVSDEERGVLNNKLAEIESRVTVKLMELQAKAIEATSKVAVQEQLSGNVLSKSWRPIASLVFVVMLALMAVGCIPFNQFLAGIAGGFLGIYAPLRSFIDKRKGN